ncbi:Holliday junction DNA helicase RuvA [Tannerella sp. oral taxon 808]|nr:Holliday junction DNA helicase RuvA [Tannerella sp. oral taxon 808]
MGRILAVDYGAKRTGLAVTDTLQIAAGGLTTVASAEAVSYIVAYAKREPIDEIVVGLPKQMDNRPSENMARVKTFARKLKAAMPEATIAFYDERFTSTMAHRAMIEGGLGKKRRQDKALVDEISAVIILQGYMEWKKNQPSY